MPYSKNHSRPIIAIAGMALQGFEGEIIKGIQRFGHTYGWQIFNANTPTGRSEMIRNRRFIDGVIAVVADDTSRKELSTFKCPVINVSDTFPKKYRFPAVLPDDARIGIIAAEYFMERGYRQFATHLLPEIHPYRYLSTRTGAFMAELAKHGFGCMGIKDLYTPEQLEMARQKKYLLKFFRELPKPLAVFCADDQLAAHLCFVAQTSGIRRKIPEEIAVLGVDNFELHCNMTSPPLSSIDPNGQAIGEEAATLMHSFLTAQAKPSSQIISVPPGKVVVRDSARPAALNDPSLAKAIQFINDNCHLGINVANVVKGTGVNRRKLEILFRREFGHTILHELNQARVRRAKKLWRDTDFPQYKIANLAGFRDPHQMQRVFTRHGETWLSPKMEKWK